MCKSVFSAGTAKLAINTDTSTIYNSSNAAGGCNTFGHTVMTTSSAAALAAPNALATVSTWTAHKGPLTHSVCSIGLAGRWMGNFGTSFVINNTMWLEVGSSGSESHITVTKFTSTYAILHLPADDSWNPSKYAKAEFHSNGDGTYGMCKSVFSAGTAKLAINTDTSTIYNSSNAAGGCNGFGHTVMTPLP